MIQQTTTESVEQEQKSTSMCVIEQGTHVNKSGYCGLVPCCAMSQGEVFVILPILCAF